MSRIISSHHKLFGVLALLLVLYAPSAFAACSSPAGNEGDIVYDSTNHLMDYCNGSGWITMGQTNSISFGTLTAGDLCWATSGTAIACTGTLSGDVTSTGGSALTTTVVTAINGVSLGTTTATSGNLLIGSGSQWVTRAVSGDVTINSTGVTAIGANKVTVGDIAQIAGLSVLGNTTSSTANVLAITGTANQTLVVNSAGTALGFGTLGIAGGGTNAVTQTTNGVNYYNGTSITSGAGFVYTGTAVGIATTTPSASALLDVYSTTQGILPPRMTTTQRNAITSPATGLTIYNTTNAELETYDGAVLGWEAVGSAALDAGGSNTQVQYNSSGELGADAGFTYANGAITLGSTSPAHNGTVVLNGSSSGAVTIQPQAVAGTYNFNLPTSAGSAGSLFISGGGGATVSAWLPDVATGSVLISGGATSSPSYSTTLPTTVQSNITTVGTIGAGVWNGTVIGILYGGTGQTTAQAARSSVGLDIDEMTTHGDSAYVILATDRVVATSATLTAARTWTLPAASAVNAGQKLCVVDQAGGVTSTNTLTVSRAGSDTVNGSTTYVIKLAYGGICLASDGTSKWTTVGGGSSTPGGSNTQVQYNSGGVFAGDASFTYITPGALTLGVTSGSTGTLALAGTTSGTVTIQPQAAAGTYNFNLPTTAGSPGQPLLSGGGSGTAMTFGTLGVGAGGTGSATAFTQGSVVFAGASGVYSQDNANFYWDATNHRLGIGTTTMTQPLTVWGNIDAANVGGYLTEIANAGTTGTTVNKLAKVNTSGAAVIAATTDTDGMIGVVIGGAGTSGNALISIGGQASCVFDGATTAGDFVTISSVTAGDCSDAGIARPAGSQSIGRVLSTNASGGTYVVALGLGGTSAGNMPTGTIAAFASSSCPTGWTEYTPARGRFLRGIDNGAGNDPDGTRSPGATQADMVGPHSHNISGTTYATASGSVNGSVVGGGTGSSTSSASTLAASSNGTAETRPKNVAVTFCQYAGSAAITGGVTAAGATNYIARWMSATTIGTGLMYDNGIKVGLGTTSPGADLTVQQSNNTQNTAGLKLIANGSSDDFSIFEGGDHNGYLWNNAASGGLGLWVGGATEAMFINSTGGVGIGTTTVANTLDVNGKASIGYKNIAAPTNGLLVSGMVGIGTATTVNDLDVFGAAAFGSYAGQTAPSGGIIASGSVGIGTVTPESMLETYNGEVQIGSSGVACTGTNAGALRYSGGALYYCNSSTWTTPGSGSVSSGTQYQMGYYATTGTAITGDANITTDASNDLIIGGGTLAIGTTTVTNAINISGQAAKTIGMVRDVTASTAGQNLTLTAGGAVFGGTNLAGGNLILSSGIATGNASSNVQFQVYPAGSTGTTDTTGLTALTVSATGAAGTTAATTVQANAGSGTNQNGGTLTLASGVSTGNGSSGMSFNVYGAGSTGSTANAATTAMTITSVGNVGIGTATPANKLDVNGATAVGTYAGTLAPTNGMIVSGEVGIGTAKTVNDLDVFGGAAFGSYAGQAAPASGIIVSGNVGIGSASPNYALDVNTGTVAGTVMHVIPQAVTLTTAGSSGGLTLNTAATGQMAYYSNASTISGTNDLYVTGTTIGIGTATTNTYDAVAEQRPLVVAAADASTTIGGSASTLVITNTDTTANNTSALAFADITGAFASHMADAEIVDIHGTRTNTQYNSGKLVFMTAPGGNVAPAERMRIDQAGNVGIGTTSPATPLDVAGTGGNTTATFRASLGVNSVILQSVNGGGNYGSYLQFTDNATNSATIKSVASGGLRFATAGTERVTLDGSGNVGIGSSSPVARLDLGGGNIRMGFALTTNTCSSTSSCTATCPGGTQALGGGCVRLIAGSIHLMDAQLGATSYFCNWDATGTSVQAQVTCANIQ